MLNSLFKRVLNSEGTIDSQGVLFSFLVPSVVGFIISSIVAAIDTQIPGSTGRNVLLTNRNFGNQGGVQIAAIGVAMVLGAVGGLIVGVLYRCLNGSFETPDDEFNDQTFINNIPLEDVKKSVDIKGTEIEGHSKLFSTPGGPSEIKLITTHIH